MAPLSRSEIRKRWREKLTRLGKCLICGKADRERGTICEPCYVRGHALQRARRERLARGAKTQPLRLGATEDRSTTTRYKLVAFAHGRWLARSKK